jgi:hypothetical protein
MRLLEIQQNGVHSGIGTILIRTGMIRQGSHYRIKHKSVYNKRAFIDWLDITGCPNRQRSKKIHI